MMQTCLIFRAVCVAAGLAGHQRVPLRPFLHGLPGGEMVLHQSPAGGESQHTLRPPCQAAERRIVTLQEDETCLKQ